MDQAANQRLKRVPGFLKNNTKLTWLNMDHNNLSSEDYKTSKWL